MCWLPLDQPLLLPGDSSCTAAARHLSPCSAAQLLASRLRRIGDRLEKQWTAAGEPEAGCRDRGDRGGGGKPVVSGGGRLKGLLCMAVRLTVLVLLVARRHL